MFDTLTWSGDGLEVEPRLAESWKPIDADDVGVQAAQGREVPRRLGLHRRRRRSSRSSAFRWSPARTRRRSTCVASRKRRSSIRTRCRSSPMAPRPVLPNDFIRLFIVSSKAAAGLTKETANEAFNSRQGRGRHRPVQVRVVAAQGRPGAGSLRRLLGPEGAVGAACAQGDPERRRARGAAEGRSARPHHPRAGDRRRVAEDVTPSSTVDDDRDGLRVQPRTRHARHAAGRPDLAKDGSPLPKNPLLDARVREAIDLAIDRKTLAEIAMEGLGKPVNQIVTPSIFGFNKALPERKYDVAAAKKLLADAGYPNGFKVQFSFTKDRLPGDTPGRHLDRADAGRDRHRRHRQRAAGERVLPGAHPRRILDVDVGLGHVDRRGALHAVVDRALERQGEEDGCVQRARLQEPGDGQAAAGRGHRDGRWQAPRLPREGATSWC